MPQKPFDPSKPCRLRSGTPVRIVDQNYKGDNLLYIAGTSPNEYVSWVLKSGRVWNIERESAGDLVNIPERIHREGWVNVYQTSSVGTIHSTRAQADNVAGCRRACVKVIIDCEEGEGL